MIAARAPCVPAPAPMPGTAGRQPPPPACPTAEMAMGRALARLDPAIARWARVARRRAMIQRIVSGVTGHFKTRITEWFAAAALFQLGLTLVTPPPSFPLSASWAVMAMQLPEETWGLIMLAIAGTRLMALGINGTFRAFRYSPHIRAFTALLAAGVWFQVTLSIWQSAPGSTALGTYRLFLFLELWNVWRAGVDTGLVERARHG